MGRKDLSTLVSEGDAGKRVLSWGLILAQLCKVSSESASDLGCGLILLGLALAHLSAQMFLPLLLGLGFVQSFFLILELDFSFAIFFSLFFFSFSAFLFTFGLDLPCAFVVRQGLGNNLDLV